MATQHVILVTYGEPPDPAFVDQLQYSWRILLGLTRTIADIPKPLLPLIAVSRGRLRSSTWRSERYSSPLEAITVRQARALETHLNQTESACQWRVHVAYEFRAPLIADALASLPLDEPVVIIPMYAADSAFTHALSRAAVDACAHSRPLASRARVLPAFDAETLGDVLASHVLESVASQPQWRGPNVALVLAAHGTLLAPSRPVETGLAATERLVAAIRSRLSTEFGTVVNGWLNHTRGGRWTEPAMDDALQGVADGGFRKVVYFPYGFLADNAETELEGRVALRKQTRLEALHLPCVNDSPQLISALAGTLIESKHYAPTV
jgi:protoporphyrin/coproporphyrin ferrochelatase